MAKTVVVDFTDGAQKPYTGVPDKILDDRETAGRAIVARAKKDYPKKQVQTWVVEDGERFIAPTVDEEINSFDDFPKSFILSKNGKRIIKLGDLVKNALVDQRGLTVKEIVQNLRNLSINSLDPIKAKYPNMRISSGFRVQGSVKAAVENSDHDVGGAADLVFANADISEYPIIAEWISKNVPHKQLLLEYKMNKDESITVWIHIAYLQANGTLLKSPMTVGTMWNHKVKQPEGAGQLVALA